MCERVRCSWVNLKNEIYVKYHDEEWGHPIYDDARLYELLVLECFQAGLSWECVLNKRENFRAAFDGFELERVIAYGEEKITELMRNPGIIRNRLKIRAPSITARSSRQLLKNTAPFQIIYGPSRMVPL